MIPGHFVYFKILHENAQKSFYLRKSIWKCEILKNASCKLIYEDSLCSQSRKCLTIKFNKNLPARKKTLAKICIVE